MCIGKLLVRNRNYELYLTDGNLFIECITNC